MPGTGLPSARPFPLRSHGAVCTQLGTLLPARFLSMLEEEIYGENSPIWEADFTVPAAEGAQLVSRSGTEG